jgi:pyruvate dehydrogenase E1 component
MYRFESAPQDARHRATILFSGTAHAAAREARDLLAERYGVGAELWSVTSYKKLREEALAVERWNRLHPNAEPRVPLVTRLLAATKGPVVAVTDFMAMVPDQIARWVPRRLVTLGTDGFGRSDTREALRRFFETDTAAVTVATLSALSESGELEPALVGDAIEHLGVDPDIAPPWVRDL